MITVKQFLYRGCIFHKDMYFRNTLPQFQSPENTSDIVKQNSKQQILVSNFLDKMGSNEGDAQEQEQKGNALMQLLRKNAKNSNIQYPQALLSKFNWLQKVQELRFYKIQKDYNFSESKQKQQSNQFLTQTVLRHRIILQISKKIAEEFVVISVIRDLLLDSWAIRIYCPKNCRNFTAQITKQDFIQSDPQFLITVMGEKLIFWYENQNMVSAAFQREFPASTEDSALAARPVSFCLGGGRLACWRSCSACACVCLRVRGIPVLFGSFPCSSRANSGPSRASSLSRSGPI